ncbi:MAG TPA: hypothetical protein VLX92_23280 [Kofleriaceae bacterium]|nr:hypothetical protein [Kofleriaceae bacterium]
MPYRSDVEALEARLRALDAELRARTRVRDEAAGLLADARRREREARIDEDIARGGPMRRRRLIALVAAAATALCIVAALVLGRTPRDPGVDDALDQLDRFGDQMCACRNQTCAQAVTDEVTTWATLLAQKQSDLARPSEAQNKRAQAIADRFGECTTRAMQQPPVP